MNYFAYQSTAKRYASFRPYFHPLVIEKIKAFLHLEDPVLHALDIACGTGQSSFALTAIASEVIGVESSQAMLAEAIQAEHIHYLPASAENIPLPDSAFDIMTVANAFHWFDRTRFLPEAARVLHTQSNIIAAVEQGIENVEHVYEWLLHELTPLFPTERGTFLFGGEIEYLQKGE